MSTDRSNNLRLQSTYYNIDIYNDNSTNANINSLFNANFQAPLLDHPNHHEICVCRARVPLDAVPISQTDIPYQKWAMQLTTTDASGDDYVESGYVPQFNTQTITTPVYTTYNNSYYTSSGSNFIVGYIDDTNTWNQLNAPVPLANSSFVAFSDNYIYYLIPTGFGNITITKKNRASPFETVASINMNPTANINSDNLGLAATDDAIILLCNNADTNHLECQVYSMPNSFPTPPQNPTSTFILDNNSSAFNVISDIQVQNFIIQMIDGVPYFTIGLNYTYNGTEWLALSVYSFVGNVISSPPICDGSSSLIGVSTYFFPSIMMVDSGHFYFQYIDTNNSLNMFYSTLTGDTITTNIDSSENYTNSKVLAGYDSNNVLFTKSVGGIVVIEILNLDSWATTLISNPPLTQSIYGDKFSTTIQTGTTTTITPGTNYQVYNIQQYMTQINTCFNTVYAALTYKVGSTCPQIQYNSSNNSFEITADASWITTNKIEFNNLFYNQFKFLGNQTTYGWHINIFENQPILGLQGCIQPSPTISQFIDFTRIVVQTSKMGVRGDCELSNNVLLSINDFVVDTSSGLPSLIVYEPAILRWYQLYQTVPLMSLNIFFTYATKSGTIYPINISPYESIGLKLQFRNSNNPNNNYSDNAI